MLPVAPIGILSSVAGGYIISGSAYGDGSSGYLSWTPSAASSGYQYGVGAWVRRIKLGVDDIILSAGTNGNNYERLYFDTGDKLAWQLGNSGVLDGELKTTAVYRDVGAWMHVAIIRNGSTATLYVNGEAITSYSTNNQPGATDAPDFGNTVEHNIWRYNSGAAYGYSEIARLVFQAETLPDIADLIASSDDDYTYPLDVSGLDFTGTNSFLLEGGTNVAAGISSLYTSAALSSYATSQSFWDAVDKTPFTFSGDDIARTTTVEALRSYYALTGDFTVTLTITSGTTSVRVGVYDPSEDGTYSDSTDDGGLDSMTNSFYIDFGNGEYRIGGSNQGAVSIAAGSVVTITRSGSTISVTDDASTVHTFGTGYSGEARIVIAGGGAVYDIDDITIDADGFVDYAFFKKGTITATNDSPTDSASNGYGNFCRWNPNEPSANVYASGNQTVTLNASNEAARGTIAVNSGRYYFELHCDAIGGDGHTGAGIQKADESLDLSNSTATVGAETWVYWDDGRTINNGANATTGLTNYTTGAVIGVDLDLDSGTVAFYHNDSLQVTETITTGIFYSPYAACHAASTNTWTLKTDSADWTYSAKGDGVALATQNFAAPTITPSEHANVVLYTGNGSTQSITGAGFQPDFVWIKNRDQADSHVITDAVRGAGEILSSDATTAETTDSDTTTSFDSDGYSLGADVKVNTSTEDYWSLVLKANGAGSSNSDGSITATVSANTTSGFSIVKWTGNATAGATVGHGLGVPPSMIIVKNLDGTNQWTIYHKTLGNAQQIEFRTNAKQASTAWNSTDPGNDVFTIGSGSDVNGSGNDYIAYCFADVADLATSIFRIGSYTGNASADGPMTTHDASTLLRIMKQSTGGNAWYTQNTVTSPSNPATTATLSPNSSAAEDSSGGVASTDFVSNGVKVRATDGAFNGSGSTYIYLDIIDKFLAGGADAWTQGRAR